MAGPAPKDASQRRRRNSSQAERILPIGGWKGKPPAWPMSGVSEPPAWKVLWAKPQAAIWAGQGYDDVVALLARITHEIATSESLPSPALITTKTALEDRLGLSPKAAQVLRLRMAEDEVAEKRDEAKPSRMTSKQAQLKIVG